MKKEVQQALIIGAVVILVLAAIGIAWKSLTDGNPPRENSANTAKPDPLPQGVDPSRLKVKQQRGEPGP